MRRLLSLFVSYFRLFQPASANTDCCKKPSTDFDVTSQNDLLPDLFVSMLQRLGLEFSRFASSAGTMPNADLAYMNSRIKSAGCDRLLAGNRLSFADWKPMQRVQIYPFNRLQSYVLEYEAHSIFCLASLYFCDLFDGYRVCVLR